MRITLRLAALLMAASLPVHIAMGEEPGPFASPTAAATLSQPELDQLLAPIALHPDALLTQILVASTYPLEVVSLQRWLDRNPGLSGDALTQALAREPWDESVKALAPFPRLAAMMSGELEWTQRLGNAFLAQQDAVMDTVQKLREKALEQGTLRDDSRERVAVDEQGTVIIEPVSPEVVYVPAYDPALVYGPWWWPAYPPYYWPAYYDGPAFWVGGIGYGPVIVVGGSWHGHRSHFDWHRHRVDVRHPGGSSPWRHDSSHRGGFGARPGGAAPRPEAHPFARELPRQRVSPPQPASRLALDPQSRDIGRAPSQRGHPSLGGVRAPSTSRPAHAAAQPAPLTGRPAPSAAHPAPSISRPASSTAHPAPAPRDGGSGAGARK